MNILVAHNVPNNRKGGMSRIMGFIHDELVEKGHRVDFFCQDNLPISFHGRLGRYCFPAFVHLFLRNQARSGLIYDWINIHEPVAIRNPRLGFPGSGTRLAITSHGSEDRAWRLGLEEERLGRIRIPTMSRILYPNWTLKRSRRCMKKADHVFCLNEEDRRYFTSELGLSSEKVTRIFPAASPVFSNASVRRNYDKVRSLLFAGTWRHNKGIIELTEAYCRIQSQQPDLYLNVLGAGAPEEVVLRDFPSSARPSIRVLTAKDDAEAARIYAESDLFLLPSLFEGTPLTLMEAMHSGLPVITTSTCGMKDVIQHGKNGWLIPIRNDTSLADAALRLAGDGELRRRLGEQAREDARRQYTWDKVAQPLARVYLKS